MIPSNSMPHFSLRKVLCFFAPTLLGTAISLLEESNALADEAADKRMRYETYALTQSGDPLQGKTLFLENQALKCSVCHRAEPHLGNSEGGQVGPDLSLIGRKFDRPHLIESILTPSSLIVEGYRTTLITTNDDVSVSGIVKRESDNELELTLADGKRTCIPIQDIAARKESSVSIMPDALENLITESEFADLIAFLETLRGNETNSPGSATSGPIRVPDGFQVQIVATGLSGSTAIETLPDGRVLVCEQQGTVRIIVNDRLLSQPVVTLPVDSTWERGVIGVTVDPHFETNSLFYVLWVAKDPYPHHRLSRFQLKVNVAVPGSETLLLQGDDQCSLGGNVPAGHQGGAIHFGNDGMLYVAIGEQTAGMPSQRLDTYLGKLLRIGPSGSIPSDNPLLERTSGKYQAIYAYGLRNPFTFAVRKSDGLILINDVGGQFEEVNIGQPGANYGWPTEQGPTDVDGISGPLYWYPEASIAGGDFIPSAKGWPTQWHGHYLFADFVHGWIKIMDPDLPEVVKLFCTGLQRPVDMRFAVDGSLYVLLRNAWVIDGKFPGGTGTVLKIAPR
jgi:putative heme-binding domain-containing protein